MKTIVVTVAAAAALFAGTNIDDMVVLAVLNVSSRADGRPSMRQIWAGQYAGVAVLVAISLLGALGLAFVPERWIWLLGLLPLGLGVGKLAIAIQVHNRGGHVSPAGARGLTSVIGLTIANGGDNIAAYTPVFRAQTARETVITIAVFAVGVALWCLVGFRMVRHPMINQVIQRWGHWIVPAVYILIGLFIFRKTGVLP